MSLADQAEKASRDIYGAAVQSLADSGCLPYRIKDEATAAVLGLKMVEAAKAKDREDRTGIDAIMMLAFWQFRAFVKGDEGGVARGLSGAHNFIADNFSLPNGDATPIEYARANFMLNQKVRQYSN